MWALITIDEEPIKKLMVGAISFFDSNEGYEECYSKQISINALPH